MNQFYLTFTRQDEKLCFTYRTLYYRTERVNRLNHEGQLDFGRQIKRERLSQVKQRRQERRNRVCEESKSSEVNKDRENEQIHYKRPSSESRVLYPVITGKLVKKTSS